MIEYATEKDIENAILKLKQAQWNDNCDAWEAYQFSIDTLEKLINFKHTRTKSLKKFIGGKEK